VASVGLSKRRLCRACFDGVYPAPIPAAAAETMRLFGATAAPAPVGPVG